MFSKIQSICLTFHGEYNPWGRKESDATEQLSHSLLQAHKTL